MAFAFIDTYYGVVLFNFSLAALLGFMMGYEREKRGISAGLRTFALICMGSTMFTMVSINYFPLDSARVVAQIISGVGFIGAGIIWKQDGGIVHGVTTAADIWVAAGVGISVGTSQYFMAIIASILVILILKIHTKNDEVKK